MCAWPPALASVRARTTQPGAGPGTGLVDTSTLARSIDDFFVIQTTATFPLAAKSPQTLTGAGLTSEQLPRATMRDAATNQDGCVDAPLTLGLRAVGEEKR